MKLRRANDLRRLKMQAGCAALVITVFVLVLRGGGRGPSEAERHAADKAAMAKLRAPSAAIVYLTGKPNNPMLLQSLRDLATTCDFAAKYPILLMVTPGCVKGWGCNNNFGRSFCHPPKKCNQTADSSFASLPAVLLQPPFDKLDIRVIDVSAYFGEYPDTKHDPALATAIDQVNPSWAITKFHWSYRAMCNFWIQRIFDVPQIKDLEYYLRIDTDARFQCREADFDPFKQVLARSAGKKGGAETVYAFYNFVEEAKMASIGLNEMVAAYLQADPGGVTAALPKALVDKYWAHPGHDDKAPSFYNNMELVSVPFFQRPEIKRFNQAVSRSLGIWSYRWGDACVRFAQVLLFSKPEQRLCFNLSRDIKYSHASGPFAVHDWCEFGEQADYVPSERME